MDYPSIEAWKKAKLGERGLNPAEFDIAPDGQVVPIAPQAVTPPVAGDSPLTTGAKSFGWSLPEVAAGLAGAGAAGQAASVALDATGIGVPAGIAGHVISAIPMIAGAALGGYAANRAKKAIAPGIDANVEASAAQNPTSAKVGSLAAQVVGMRPSLGVMKLAASGARNLATGVGATAAEKAAMSAIAAGAGISGGMNVGEQLVGDQPFDVGSALESTLVGSALHQPTKVGSVISGLGGLAPRGRMNPIENKQADYAREGRDIIAGARGAQPTDYSGQVFRPGDEALAATDQALGLPRKPGEAWDAYTKRVAANKFAQDQTVGPVDQDGEPRYGVSTVTRDAAGVGNALISPNAFHNTRPHEALHQYIQDVATSGDAAERDFIARGIRKYGSEEAFVQAAGEHVLARLGGDDSLLRDVGANIKDKVGGDADYARLLSARYLRGRGVEGMELPKGAAQPAPAPVPNRGDDMKAALDERERQEQIVKQAERLKLAIDNLPMGPAKARALERMHLLAEKIAQFPDVGDVLGGELSIEDPATVQPTAAPVQPKPNEAHPLNDWTSAGRNPVENNVTAQLQGTRRYQGGDQIESPEFAKWFGDWKRARQINEDRANGKEVSNEENAQIRKGLSKVVDNLGRPMVVYHGTKRGVGQLGTVFNTFSTEHTVEMGQHFGTQSQANDFAAPYRADINKHNQYELADPIDDRAPTDAYGLTDYARQRIATESPRTYPVYLDIKNPFISPDLFGSDPSNFVRWAQKNKILDPNVITEATNAYLSSDYRKGWQIVKRALREKGYDGVKYVNEQEGNVGHPDNIAWIAFDEGQVKSASGNKGTFNRANPDIRYQGSDEPVPADAVPRESVYSKFKEGLGNITKGLTDRLETSGLPSGAYAAGRFRTLFARQREMAAQYNDPIQRAIEPLNPVERDVLRKALLTEDQAQAEGNEGRGVTVSMRGSLSAKNRAAYDVIRATIKAMAEDRVAAGHTLWNGEERGVTEHYFPNVMRGDVANVLYGRPGTPEWNKLRDEFVEYNAALFQKRGMGAEEAMDTAEKAFGKYSGAAHAPSTESRLKYGPADLPANTKLPENWIEKDLSRAMQRYTNSFARAAARHDVLDSDPRMRALLGETTMKNGQPLPAGMNAENPSLMTVPSFSTLLEAYGRGGMPGSSERIMPSVGRFVNSLLISGPRTKITDALTSVFKAIPHLPAREIPGLVANMVNFRQSLDNSFANGLNNRTGQIVMHEVLGAGEHTAHLFDRLAEGVVKYTGAEYMERAARGLAQNMGEYIVKVNRPLAQAGDARALRLMNHLGDDWATADAVNLGGRVARIFQGNYDVAHLPPWMFDSPVAPFVTMMKWSTEQYNNFNKFAWQPALAGDYAPLVMTLASGLGGGLVLNELREMLSGKKEQNPTFAEIAAAKDKPAAAAELMAKFVKYAQVTGTLGLVGELGAQATDVLNGRLAQGFRYPAASLAQDAVERSASAAKAIIEGEPAAKVLAAYAGDLARGNIQMLQFVDGALGAAGVDMFGSTTRKDETEKRRDLRVFERLNGYDQRTNPTRFAPYDAMSDREFGKADPATAAKMAPDLIKRAIAKANGDPERMKEEFRKLRTASIPGMPSPDSSPLRFAKYLQWRREQGDTENAGLKDYVRARAAKEARLKMVPGGR